MKKLTIIVKHRGTLNELYKHLIKQFQEQLYREPYKRRSKLSYSKLTTEEWVKDRIERKQQKNQLRQGKYHIFRDSTSITIHKYNEQGNLDEEKSLIISEVIIGDWYIDINIKSINNAIKKKNKKRNKISLLEKKMKRSKYDLKNRVIFTFDLSKNQLELLYKIAEKENIELQRTSFGLSNVKEYIQSHVTSNEYIYLFEKLNNLTKINKRENIIDKNNKILFKNENLEELRKIAIEYLENLIIEKKKEIDKEVQIQLKKLTFLEESIKDYNYKNNLISNYAFQLRNLDTLKLQLQQLNYSLNKVKTIEEKDIHFSYYI